MRYNMVSIEFKPDSIILFQACYISEKDLEGLAAEEEMDEPDPDYLFWDLESQVQIQTGCTVVGNGTGGTGMQWQIVEEGEYETFIGYRTELLSIAAAQLEKVDPSKSGQKIVSFLTLWSYRSWKDPDNWTGPSEWYSEWELVGEIKPTDLLILGECIKDAKN